MSIGIELERTVCEPASVVRGQVVLAPSPEAEDRKVELSVLWQTEGKGNTDLGVVLHRELPAGEGTHGFEVRLPLLPVSYRGALVSVRWLVRVRRVAFMADDELEEAELEVRWP